ncbi:MAG: fimbrillin family protein [Bacteroidales bacterium]|nr:fimbrillin family protein [Bacteroidales bacterium]
MSWFRKIALCALAAAALCSCSKKVTVIAVHEVFFTASVKTYSTKASDSAFENGDKVRILAGSPIGETAVGTIRGNLIDPDVPMYWIKNQKESTTFAAIYQADKVAGANSSLSYDLLSGGRHDYNVHNRLLVALSTVKPLETVGFEFNHPFSKILINITNKLSGSDIQMVEVKGVVMKGKVNLEEQTLDLTGPKETVEAYKLADRKYAAVVMPQTAAPVIMVTANGDRYRFELDAPFTFEPGFAYSADITLEPGIDPEMPVAATFSFTVTSWEDGAALDYEPVTD